MNAINALTKWAASLIYCPSNTIAINTVEPLHIGTASHRLVGVEVDQLERRRLAAGEAGLGGVAADRAVGEGQEERAPGAELVRQQDRPEVGALAGEGGQEGAVGMPEVRHQQPVRLLPQQPRQLAALAVGDEERRGGEVEARVGGGEAGQWASVRRVESVEETAG